MRSHLYRPPPAFAWIAATFAAALAVIGVVIVAGAGPSPEERIMAVLIGFLLLGAGAALALWMVIPGGTWHSAHDDWPG